MSSRIFAALNYNLQVILLSFMSKTIIYKSISRGIIIRLILMYAKLKEKITTVKHNNIFIVFL